MSCLKPMKRLMTTKIFIKEHILGIYTLGHMILEVAFIPVCKTYFRYSFGLINLSDCEVFKTPP